MKKRRKVDAGKPLPHREILKLQRQAELQGYLGDLETIVSRIPPPPKGVEVFRPSSGHKKASKTSCTTLLLLKPGIDKPCQDLCPRLEAWFKFVEPIPNNVCWLDKPKEHYINKTKNSEKSRRLVYRERNHDDHKDAVVWDKLRPLAVQELFAGKNSPPSEGAPFSPFSEGLMYQYLTDNLGNKLRYNALNNPYRFAAASHSSRYSIKWPEKVKYNHKVFARAMKIRVNVNMLNKTPYYTAPVLITEGLISNMFNRSRPKYQNKLPLGYTPGQPVEAVNDPEYNPVANMRESIAKNIPFRGVKQGYNWYVHTQREKSIRRRALNRGTPGWYAHLEGREYQQFEYGKYGLKRKPIGLDQELGNDREKLRYYAYWHRVTHLPTEHWPESRAEEYRHRYHFDESRYNWWLYNMRATCPDEANQLDGWLEKNCMLNKPRLKYISVGEYAPKTSVLRQVSNFLLKPFKVEEATFKNILPVPIGKVVTEYQHTFEEERKAIRKSSPLLLTDGVSLESLIGNLEDHMYEDNIPKVLELTKQYADDFMLHLARTELKLKETGDEVEYLAFMQAMPLIAEQFKQKFPIPMLDDNEQDLVNEYAKQEGLYNYC